MNQCKRLLSTLLLLWGFGTTTSGWAGPVTPLYSYNTPPPFHPATADNLSTYLARQFSADESDHYQFKAQHLPRKRLDILIAKKDWKGAVIWANPEWFSKFDQGRLLWSEPLATDYNLVLSHKAHPVEYLGPESLKGLRLGGILGHVYAEFETMLNQGEMVREDTADYRHNLAKLKEGRVDVTFLPSSALTALLKINPQLTHWMHISSKPRNIFQYYMFCDRSNPELMTYLNSRIQQLAHDKYWTREIDSWHYVAQ